MTNLLASRDCLFLNAFCFHWLSRSLVNYLSYQIHNFLFISIPLSLTNTTPHPALLLLTCQAPTFSCKQNTLYWHYKMNYHCEIQNRNNNSADNQVCLPPIQVLFNSIERRNVPKLAFANTDRSCDNMRCNTAEEQTYAAPVLLPQHPVVYPAVNSGLEATTIATTQFLPDSTTKPETQPVLENIKPCYKSAPIYEIINNETDMHAQAKRPIPEFEDAKSKKKQNSGRRSNLPKETVQVLNTWLLNHLNNPYPTQQEKRELLIKTGLTKIQLSNWFINVRRRKIFSDYYTLVNSIPSDNTNNTPMEQATKCIGVSQHIVGCQQHHIRCHIELLYRLWIIQEIRSCPCYTTQKIDW